MARSGQQRPHARSLRSAGMYEQETKPDAVSEDLRRTAFSRSRGVCASRPSGFGNRPRRSAARSRRGSAIRKKGGPTQLDYEQRHSRQGKPRRTPSEVAELVIVLLVIFYVLSFFISV
jgi:hypothetical protein